MVERFISYRTESRRDDIMIERFIPYRTESRRDDIMVERFISYRTESRRDDIMVVLCAIGDCSNIRVYKGYGLLTAWSCLCKLSLMKIYSYLYQ
ncbi:MAG: hypothetical protein EHM58_17330 [Ignavibacteriae bacterium]|nr:MAG: hypothetical protein EHM58_17330 [Ignavibacteriota bacterium]